MILMMPISTRMITATMKKMIMTTRKNWKMSTMIKMTIIMTRRRRRNMRGKRPKMRKSAKILQRSSLVLGVNELFGKTILPFRKILHRIMIIVIRREKPRKECWDGFSPPVKRKRKLQIKTKESVQPQVIHLRLLLSHLQENLPKGKLLFSLFSRKGHPRESR
jgi:hypothetical protein